MKLEKLIMPIIIGIVGLHSQAYAVHSFNKHKPLMNNSQDAPKEPKREEDYSDYFSGMLAILPPKDEVLEKIEVRYKR